MKFQQKNFGDFEMFSWMGDVQIARRMIIKASKKFKIKVIEGGYKPKEKVFKMKKFDFNDLFVLDLANNHQGSVEHGLKIIKECGRMVRKHNIRAAMKFQFRQYDTFIHPDHVEGSDNIHIPRFLSTQLKLDEWQMLFDAVKGEGMLTMPSVIIVVTKRIKIMKMRCVWRCECASRNFSSSEMAPRTCRW